MHPHSYAEIGRAADAQIASLQKELAAHKKANAQFASLQKEQAAQKRAKSSVKPVTATVDTVLAEFRKLSKQGKLDVMSKAPSLL